jgi:hypothetical protein
LKFGYSDVATFHRCNGLVGDNKLIHYQSNSQNHNNNRYGDARSQDNITLNFRLAFGA